MLIPEFFYPSQQLKNHICKYWYLDYIQSMPLLPPGSGCELFIFDQPITVFDRSNNKNQHLTYSVLVRPRISPIQFIINTQVSFIAVRFRLGSVSYFSDYLESDCPTIVDAFDLWGHQFHEIYEKIQTTIGMDHKIKIIETFLFTQLNSHQLMRQLSLTKHFLNEIYYSQDYFSLPKVISQLGYSQRHVQKTIKLITGLSLIETKRLIRFEYCMKFLLSHHKKDHLALYYDQSHFIKEFAHFTQMSPTKFIGEHQNTSSFYMGKEQH